MEIPVTQYGRSKDGVFIDKVLDDEGQPVQYPAAVLGYTWVEIDGKRWAVLSPKVRREDKIILVDAVVRNQGADHPEVTRIADDFRGMYVDCLKVRGWRFPNKPAQHPEQEVVWEVQRCLIAEVLSVTLGEKTLSEARKRQYRETAQEIIIPIKIPYVNVRIDESDPIRGEVYRDMDRVFLDTAIVQDKTHRTRIRPKCGFIPGKEPPKVAEIKEDRKR